MLERKADSPSYCFFEKSSEKEERLERAFVRPRQVRYQAALRPDSIEVLFDYRRCGYRFTALGVHGIIPI